MLDKKIAELINRQINREFYSAYLYLDFSNFFVEKGLNGFANWYKIQAQEERDHALLMIHTIYDAACADPVESLNNILTIFFIYFPIYVL